MGRHESRSNSRSSSRNQYHHRSGTRKRRLSSSSSTNLKKTKLCSRSPSYSKHNQSCDVLTDSQKHSSKKYTQKFTSTSSGSSGSSLDSQKIPLASFQSKVNKKAKRKLKHKKRHQKYSSSSSSDTESSSSSECDSSDSSSSGSAKRKQKDKKRRKDKKRHKNKKRKRKSDSRKKRVLDDGKSFQIMMPTKCTQEPKPEDRLLTDRAKAMAPMTKEEWDKRQSAIRRVFDEETGRHRLVKGDGEILEEIVSRDRHREINRQATKGDGDYFQATLVAKWKK